MKRTPELQIQLGTITNAAIQIYEVEKQHGKVSRLFIQQMESYKLPLLRIIAADNELKHYASRELAALNASIEYAKTGDKCVRKRMITEFKAAERVATRLWKEIED
ncbi:hypothetical protein [Lysinibacillus antri]|uniref:Uncharacterized protein n=1 Tax=Lysinibacillus antri TaxID=2498145 RepID=A0A432LAD8_9BACI|nr:hypothetical protein [Lysinibacillus antri]RUL51102.1 hypothetical protein EK386_12905 [Lysinibacillus antri]